MTSKNQLTLPREVLRHCQDQTYFDARWESGRIVLEPVVIRPWFSMITEDIPIESWIPDDPGDDNFVNAVRVCPGTHLISGEGHIFEARERLPVSVFTARELLDQLER